MRTVLVGAVESSERALHVMLAVGLPPVAVVTLPRPAAARHSDFADLAAPAREQGIEVVESTDVNDDVTLHRLGDIGPDHVLVIGWSQIFRDRLLALPRSGCIGYHPAALPENRGRAVIPWTILQDRRRTAGSLFWLDDGVDSGDLLDQEAFAVDPDEWARGLYDKHLGALETMLRRSLPKLASGAPPRSPQDHARATWCARRVPADGLIDWAATSEDVWRLVRASGDPYPGAYTFSRAGRIVVRRAEHVGPGPYWGVPGQVQSVGADGVVVQCGDRGHLRLLALSTESHAEVPAGEVLRVHERLSPEPRA